ncbi:hypothetical protein D3C86_1306720 [compost metagenome]
MAGPQIVEGDAEARVAPVGDDGLEVGQVAGVVGLDQLEDHAIARDLGLVHRLDRATQGDGGIVDAPRVEVDEDVPVDAVAPGLADGRAPGEQIQLVDEIRPARQIEDPIGEDEASVRLEPAHQGLVGEDAGGVVRMHDGLEVAGQALVEQQVQQPARLGPDDQLLEGGDLGEIREHRLVVPGQEEGADFLLDLGAQGRVERLHHGPAQPRGDGEPDAVRLFEVAVLVPLTLQVAQDQPQAAVGGKAEEETPAQVLV